jgi:hypothetical protein
MKKLLIAVTLLSLMGCRHEEDYSNRVTITKEEYNQLRNTTPEYPKHFDLIGYSGFEGFENAIILGSDGHEYLVTRSGYNNETQGHYIECKKCIAKEQHIEELLLEIIKNTSKDSTSVVR